MYYKIINRKKKFITIIADFLGYIIWAPVYIFSRKKAVLTDIKDILVIRTAYIGDVIMTLPILKPLRLNYPNAKITFLTSSKAQEVLKNNPYIDEILIYDSFWFHFTNVRKAIHDHWEFLKVLKAKRYDLVIEARGDIRDILFIAYLSKSRYRVSYRVGGGGYLLTHVVPFREIKHKVEYHLDIARYLNCKIECIEWDFYLTKSEEQKADELLIKKGVNLEKPLVAIHPGARTKLKCWPASKFASIADMIVDSTDATIVLTGSSNEVELAQQIQKTMKHTPVILAGETGLREMASLLKKCDLFICNDTSPLHIASVMKTPTVAIFGPSKSRETGPYENNHMVVEKDFPCRYICDENVCTYKAYNECMMAITPEDVFSAAKEIFNKKASFLQKSIARF